MSDSCQLDQLSLRQLDSSLAPTQFVFHTGSGCTEVFPAYSNHGFFCWRNRFFKKILSYYCQVGLYMNEHACTFEKCHFPDPPIPINYYTYITSLGRFPHGGLRPFITGHSLLTLLRQMWLLSTATPQKTKVTVQTIVWICFTSSMSYNIYLGYFLPSRQESLSAWNECVQCEGNSQLYLAILTYCSHI